MQIKKKKINKVDSAYFETNQKTFASEICFDTTGIGHQIDEPFQGWQNDVMCDTSLKMEPIHLLDACDNAG